MPVLERTGVRLFYEIRGPAGPATPVLLTHGFAASARMWEPNLAVLAGGRRVVTWDLRGHGRSDAPDDPSLYSEPLAVADMAALLDAVGVERAVIGGLSLGGYLSLAFYLGHPERVAALMLFDTGPGYRRDAARDDWNRRVERTAVAYEAGGLAAQPERGGIIGAEHGSAAGLVLAARGIMTQSHPGVIDSLPTIAVPTLVVVGAQDAPFLAAADYMAARIPGATKVVIEGAGHAANVDQADAFNRAVLAFLEDL
jgi:pimeloyl-ACP methyl ester carboxylesterase